MAERAGRAGRTGRAERAGSTGRTGRAGRAGRTGRTGRAERAGRTGGAGSSESSQYSQPSQLSCHQSLIILIFADYLSLFVVVWRVFVGWHVSCTYVIGSCEQKRGLPAGRGAGPYGWAAGAATLTIKDKTKNRRIDYVTSIEQKLMDT